MIRNYRKPLITFTPKSLLRHAAVISTLDELCEGAFEPVLDDTVIADKNNVKRVIVCSGKVYYDLLEAREDQGIEHVALIRIEQLYPFPKAQMADIIRQYVNKTEVVWCQEEPLNQGAWDSIKHRFRNYEDAHQLLCVSRPSSAAAAVGSFKTHKKEQQSLVNEALMQNESFARKI